MNTLWKPDYYYPNVTKINFKRLSEKGIRNFIFDLDNTLAHKNKGLDLDVIQAIKSALKKEYIRNEIFILTNIILKGRPEQRAQKLASELEKKINHPVRLICLSFLKRKPSHKAFEMIFKELPVKSVNVRTVMIGDQILSDIIGANKAGLTSVLVDPLDPKGYGFFSKIFLRSTRKKAAKKKLRLDYDTI